MNDTRTSKELMQAFEEWSGSAFGATDMDLDAFSAGWKAREACSGHEPLAALDARLDAVKRGMATDLYSRAAAVIRAYAQEAGDDHSVGICNCSDIALADELDAAAGASQPPRATRRGCPDLDPDWPNSLGEPRGPTLCVLYPKCKCGEKDKRAAQPPPAELSPDEIEVRIAALVREHKDVRSACVQLERLHRLLSASTNARHAAEQSASQPPRSVPPARVLANMDRAALMVWLRDARQCITKAIDGDSFQLAAAAYKLDEAISTLSSALTKSGE